MATIEILNDHPAHRQADQVRALGLAVIEQPQQVISEIAEFERLRRIVASAVAACVPGHRAEAVTKVFELPVPVGAIATDTVEKHHQRTAACHVIGDRHWTACVSCHAHIYSFGEMSAL